MELPFAKQLQDIKAELRKDLEIDLLQLDIQWRLSRLKDLEPDNAAYLKAQAILGL